MNNKNPESIESAVMQVPVVTIYSHVFIGNILLAKVEIIIVECIAKSNYTKPLHGVLYVYIGSRELEGLEGLKGLSVASPLVTKVRGAQPQIFILIVI